MYVHHRKISHKSRKMNIKIIILPFREYPWVYDWLNEHRFKDTKMNEKDTVLALREAASSEEKKYNIAHIENSKNQQK